MKWYFFDVLFWLLLLFGFYIIIINWVVFFRRYIIRSSNSSWIPIIGGFLVMCAFSLPHRSLDNFMMIGFFLDYGCFFGFVHTILFWVIVGLRKIVNL